jgi:V8-like Glu-specific endopeptidase
MKRILTVGFVVFLLMFAVDGLSLYGIQKVGEEVLEKYETPHPYGGKGLVWEQTFHWPGAGYIAIHFDDFELGKGDVVEISSPDGRFEYRYKEKGKVVKNGKKKKKEHRISEFWATHIPGDTAVVRLYGKSKKGGWGFVIDKWVRGYERGYINAVMSVLEEEAVSNYEAICSSDDKEWAKCYDGTAMYDKSKAVCRLLINGSGGCTGWLLGSEGHVMTNNHCIGNQSDANNTDYEFMAEGSTCSTSCTGWFACPGTVEASSGTLVKTSSSLDYSLVLLPSNVTSTYGYMQLRNELPSVGERIYIPQHPGGKGKMLAVNSDTDGPYAKVYSTNESPCSGGPGDIGYYADTEGGSSGSPVLGYSDNLVVALHHCANCPNRGVPIPSIVTDLGSSLPANAIGSGGGGGDPADFNAMLDTTGFTYTTGGAAEWVEDTSTYYNDGDSAANGTITHNQTSYLQTTINYASNKNVKFYWKVSSESNYDYLRFYIDGALQEEISGTVDWTQKSFAVSSGSHTLKWEYYKDGSVSSGSDKGWVDKLEIVDGGGGGGDALAQAVDEESLTFTTSGDGAWGVDTVTYYFDNDSAASPVITHDEDASFETAVSGYTSVKFYWKVSSESSYDYLKFYIDGVLQDQVSGTVDWTQQSYSVSSGSHTLKWTYAKDYSVSSGSDKGWVDKLELGAGGGSGDPIAEAVDAPTLTFSLSGDEDWYVTTADSVYGGSSVTIPSALNHNESSIMETTISGVTQIQFYWKVSSESGYDYLKFYIDGVLQDQISGTVAWTQKTYSVSSGSHTLKWEYDKDYSVSSGSDAGWVDLLQLQ